MSKRELDAVDRGILSALQGDLGDVSEPYARIAADLQVTEDEVLSRVRSMVEDGIIRRLGAMIRHIEAGIGFNGMVVWKVPPERMDEVGLLMAGLPHVTHCYERPPFGEKGCTLFTMVHAATEEGCLTAVGDMAEKSGITEYEILFSERELKKISMTYFEDESLQED
jgi:DNA-binding Lrp family transcriptional regulator